MSEPINIKSSESTFVLLNELSTEAFGGKLGIGIQKNQKSLYGLVVFLHGELAAGKTTLVRGLLRGIGHTGNVKSPTYTLVEEYSLNESFIHHFDLYRLSHPEELEFMGIREYFSEHSIVLIEWPERGKGFLPNADLQLSLKEIPEGRLLSVQYLTKRALILKPYCDPESLPCHPERSEGSHE